ncbi:tetratricopeptide repeat-containing sensor histidine kinase [uncultured Aquimarina sp.]|uniref:tetratricopeptide repeat-containing sensor histidine kinase n=1 Tax=uncultured Aquimarina sp. TaxID=575652 RepID=UPI002615EAAE|nr:tetratricopeptide repeat-containing sensor histidine kinase [uncultured Aquimarina sp.]
MNTDIRNRVLFLKLFALSVFVTGCNDKSESIKNDTSQLNLIENQISLATDKTKSKEERKKNLENAYNLFLSLPNDKYKRRKISEISAGYFSLKNYDKSELTNKEMLRLSIKINDSLGIAKSYNNFGIYNRLKKKFDSSYYYFNKAEKVYASFDKGSLFTGTNYAFDHGSTLIDLAKLSRKVKDYSNSEDLTIQAIEKFESSGNAAYIPLSYINLGIVAKQLGRFDDAIKYHLKTIERSENTPKDTLYKAISYNNMGTTYKSRKKYKKAIKYYKKALSYNSFLSSRPKRYARYIDNLGYVKFLANKKNDSSLYLFNKAYRIRDSIKDIVGLSTSYLHLTEYYQSKGDNTLSKEFAEKAKEAATTINDNIELLQAYQILAQVSPPEEGRQYAMKYIKLSDSLNKRDNLFRDKFARIRFESENLEKENEQKNEKIIEVQNQNTIYLLGMLLLVTFIGFIIFFSRQRTKYLAQQNKIVEFQTAYETETRISKRLHDEIGNDIFQVMMQYQNDPHDPQITKKLNTAYTKARDISRENSEFEVDETYVEELTDMLTNYTQNNIRLVLRGIEKISWDTVDKNLKITIYRILQELMTNMQKHSQADLVAIVFKNEKNKMIIKYSDNGVGIQKEDIKSKNGLRNTEKRIQAINGTIIFDSEKDKGFKAEIKIPC